MERTKEVGIGGFNFKQQDQDKTLEPEEVDDKLAGSLILTPKEAQQLEDDFNKLTEKTTQQNEEIKNRDQLLQYAIERAELYEFAFLQKMLVLNTQRALLWFYNQPKHSSTKGNFKSLYHLPKELPNHNDEKEAIFNSLLVYELLIVNENPELYTVTVKGEKFLKAIKLIS